MNGVEFRVTQTTDPQDESKKINSYDIQGQVNGAAASYRDLENGYELTINNLDLKEFINQLTTVELPIEQLEMNGVEFRVTQTTDPQDESKKINSYDIQGQVNGAAASYKDLENGYELTIDNLDLKEFIKQVTTVELPINANIDDAVLKVTKVTNAQGQTINNYDITGKIGDSQITYKDLPGNKYEFEIEDFPIGDIATWVENELGIEEIGSLATGDVDLTLKPNEKSIAFDGAVDLSALVKAAANNPDLPIPSLTLENPGLSYIQNDSETQYSFTFGDASSISYTKKPKNDYDFIVDNFPIGDIATWMETDLGISGASSVFTGTTDITISPNTKEIVLNGNVNFGKFIQPLIGYDLDWTVDNPILRYTTLGGTTQYSFSSNDSFIGYTEDSQGQTTFEVKNLPVGNIASVVAGELGLSADELPENWENLNADAIVSPTEKSFSFDGEVSVQDFATLVGLNLPGEIDISLTNPSLSVKGAGQNQSFDFSGTGTLSLPKDSFGDFTEIADILPGIDATASELEINGDIAVSKSSSGNIGLQLGVPLLGGIGLERKDGKWKLVAIEDGDRLTLADLGVVATNDEYSFTDLFNYEIKGAANLGLSADVSIEGNPAFPSFSVDIASDLPLFNYSSQEKAGEQDFTVDFNNMEIDLGSFLSDFAKPIIVEVDRIIEPIKPVVKALNADTKLMTELGLESTFDTDNKPGVSVLEIAQTFTDDPRIQTAIKFANMIEDVVDTVDVLSEEPGNVIIPLGSYSLKGFKAASQDEADNASNQTPKNSSNTSTKGKNRQTQKTPEQQAKDNAAYNKLSNLEGLSIPLIENPINAAYLFLGKDVDLIKYDVPDINFEIDSKQSFPLWTPPPISGELGASLTAKTDLAFGFDTKGLNEWKNEYDFDPTKAYLIFDGFYLDDLDEDRNDKPELTLEGGINAGLGVSAVVAKATLQGGVDANVSLDIEDIGEKTGESDGKVRGSEIISRINNPLSLFDLYGKIDAYLKGEIKVGLDIPFFKEAMPTVWEREFARFNLAEFSIDESGFSGSALGGTYSTSYIAGATIFLDANFNGLLDDNEPVTVTDSNGNYNLEFDIEYYDTNGNGKLDDEEGQIVTIGGVDTSSGVSITNKMVGSVESSMLTPITNLQNLLVKEKLVDSPDAGEELIIDKLGLPKTGSLKDDDPIAKIGGDEQAVKKAGVEFYLAHVELQNLVTHANAMLQGANPEFDSIDLQKLVTQGLAQAFISEQASFDLSNDSDVEFIFQEIVKQSTTPVTTNGEEEEGNLADTAENLGQEISADVIATAAQMVAEANALIDQMATEGEKQNLELVMPTVAPIKRTTQGQLTTITKELAEGELTIEDAKSDFTAQLEAGNRLEQQLISDTREVKVYSTGDGEIDENSDKNIEIVIELGEPAPNQGVNILYNISGTAIQGEDYQIEGLPKSNFSQIYIEPGETKKTLTINPQDDEISELTELITLNLRYAAESFGIDSEMQTAVVRIIDDEEPTTGEEQTESATVGETTVGEEQTESATVGETTVKNDTLEGTDNQETLYGMYGDDKIEGQGGADVLIGGHGQDSIIGGTGSDVIEGNYGHDYLEGNEGNDEIKGSEGNDTILAGADNDEISGGPDDDIISGGKGNDNIQGDEGNDIISGNADNDWLQGNEGNDILTGGEGQDVVYGGDGADYFVFESPGQALDTIVDFDPNKGDKIIIDNAGFENPTLDDFQFLNGYLYFKKKQIALIQNEGVSYNYFQNLSSILEIKDTTNLKTPVSPEVEFQETENASTSSQSVYRSSKSNQKPSNLLEEILDRGYIKVGVLGGIYGHSIQDADDQWQGVSIDYAKALAAALFGDETKLEFVDTESINQGIDQTSKKEVDVGIIDAHNQLVRDGNLNVDFSPIYLYDNMVLLFREDSGINSSQDLEGRKIAVLGNSAAGDGLRSYLETKGIKGYTIVPFDNHRKMLEAYQEGEVDVVNVERSWAEIALKEFNKEFNFDPNEHKILDEEISQEPLAMILPENESEWADVVRWSIYTPIQAEEFGITANNLDQIKANSNDPKIKRFLGLEGDLGEALGIPQTFTENIIKSVGNFGEIHDRNFPDLKFKRYRNNLSINDGMLYSPPFGGTRPSDTELIDNDERGLLQKILERGNVRVGITGDKPELDETVDGVRGFDIDLSRALAAALFGDPDKVEFVTQSFTEGFPNVANGEVDVSAMGVTHNLVRDAAMGVDYSPIYMYTGQGILVRKDSGITSLPMLNGSRIGMLKGSTARQNMEDNLAKVGGNFVPVEFLSNDQIFTAYENGDIDAVISDLPILSTRIRTFSDSENHSVLNEVLSKEPLALVLDENQSDWADVVRWVTYSLVKAEELGITKDNVDELMDNSNDPVVRRLLGVESNLGEMLGLPNDYALQIIKAVGNYGEMYERHFNSEILPRDLNELYTSFGLQYGLRLGTPPKTQAATVRNTQAGPVMMGEDDENEVTDTPESDVNEENTLTPEDETGEQPIIIIDPNTPQESPEEELEVGPAIIGNDFSNTLSGTLGPDLLYGMRGDDLLYGNQGEDTIYGGKGEDSVIGGNDDDLLYGDNDNDILEGEAGNDEAHGNGGLDSVNGGDGDDLLHGGKDDDRVIGGIGKDTVYGDKGNDLLEGNKGNDLLYGGQGDDTLYGGKDDDLVMGGIGEDRVLGDKGDDMLHGGKDDDLVMGGIGEDTVLGDKGNDLLEGNEDDDLLNGGQGDDTLRGGEGSDRFVLAPRNGRDIIQDFEDGIDLLRLDGGLAFENLTLTEESGSTVITFGNQRLALVSGVASSLLTPEDFLIAESESQTMFG
jgi:ABC-type amino acid transport substrate-binding protein/Ca2+-binding RTX toxin-like protein